VAKDLKNGDVYFEPIFRYREDSSAAEPNWEKMGELNNITV
jgi:pilus assembly protein CpaF